MSNDRNAPNDEPEDDTGRAAKAAAIIGAVFALVALSSHGTRAAWSVLVGAAIAIANLLTMRAIIRALVQAPADDTSEGASGDGADATGEDAKPARTEPPTNPKETGRRGGAAWGIFAGFKILILFGGIWILLTQKLVDPMPLVIGYGVLPLGIAASALWSSLRTRH